MAVTGSVHRTALSSLQLSCQSLSLTDRPTGGSLPRGAPVALCLLPVFTAIALAAAQPATASCWLRCATPNSPKFQSPCSYQCVLVVFVKWELIHTATPDTTQTGLFCRVWCGGVNWVGPTARQVRSVLCRSVSGGAVRPPDALRRRTHLPGGQFTPPHQTRQDCRACLSTAAAATQARQAATPSRPTAHTQRRCTPRKCKHAAACCVWLNLNFFTERHATRVIYRLTVQTLPDGLDSQFTPPDTTQTALSPYTV